MLQLSMKSWNSAFNAQSSKLIIVVVHLGAVKIYVAAAVEALRKKETQDETQFTTKIDGFLSFIPPWMLMYFSFAGSPYVWPNSGFRCCVFLMLLITLLSLSNFSSSCMLLFFFSIPLHYLVTAYYSTYI